MFIKERRVLPKFTKTQQRILAVLSDGLPHLRKELWATVPSVQGMAEEHQKEFARLQTNQYLVGLRSKLRIVGEDIVCEIVNRRLCYRHVRLLRSNGSTAYVMGQIEAS